MPAYRNLDADYIIRTLETLHRRIEERFQGRGLGRVCAALLEHARDSKAEATALAEPNWLLRLAIGLIIVIGGVVFAYVGTIVNFSRISTQADNLVQGLEAAINTLLLAGLGIAFLVTAEARYKRRRALRDLHELRTIIHVIDMHQLTKDPSLRRGREAPTASSPRRAMSEFELTRYLDYCSEMLSMTGKVAALYAQYFPDEVVVGAVHDLETLSTNLCRKIWQKIMILHSIIEADNALDRS